MAIVNNTNGVLRRACAAAGGIMNGSVRSCALKKGFYVLEPSGDTMEIAATPDAWRPKKW